MVDGIFKHNTCKILPDGSGKLFSNVILSPFDLHELDKYLEVCRVTNNHICWVDRNNVEHEMIIDDVVFQNKKDSYQERGKLECDVVIYGRFLS